MRNENMGQKMARGTAWVTASSYIVFVISFLTGIVLARKVDPAVFGIFAFASAIIGMMRMVGGIGYTDYLIRHEEAGEEIVGTVFSVSVLLGLLVIVLWAIASPFLVIYGSPGLAGLTAILAGVAAVGFAGEVPGALLQREFAMKKVAMIQLGVGVLVCAATLATVLTGGALSALVVNGAGTTLLTAACYFIAVPRRWGAWRWDRKIVAELVQKARSFLGTGAIMAFTGQLDKFLMGFMLPEAQLGFYNRGQRMSGLFSVIVPTGVTRAILPAFSSVRGDRPKLVFTYDLLMSLHLLVLGPLGVALFFGVEPLIELLYGERWLPAAPVFQIMVLLIVVTPLVGVWMLLHISLNHPERMARARVIGLAIFLPVLWFGLKTLGIVGAAGAIALFEIVSFIALGAYTSRFLGARVAMRPLWPHVLAASISFPIIDRVARQVESAGAALVVQLLAIGSATLLIYFVVLLLVDRQRIVESVRYFLDKLGVMSRVVARS